MAPVSLELGHPRVHMRCTSSTNAFARTLALAGAPHGTLVTATGQLAGRGRQGRAWTVPAGSALLASWVIREPPRLLSLAAGVAVAQSVEAALGERSARPLLKWPNDVLLDGRKVAGILVEGRPQQRWAVLGLGLNVAVEIAQLPLDLRGRAGTLGLTRTAIEPVLTLVNAELARWLAAAEDQLLSEFGTRDALSGRLISWTTGSGTADGIDSDGRLLVLTAEGERVRLDAGEVHLGTP